MKKYGGNFAELLSSKSVMESEVRLLHALQIYRPSVLSKEAVADTVVDRGQVRLVGSGPTLIRARTIRVLEGSVKPAASLPYNALVERVEFVAEEEGHVHARETGSNDVVRQNDAVDVILNRMDMGDLTGPQRASLQQVIGKYQSTFSKDDDDLGFCDLVE